MTKAELIEALQAFPDDTLVVTDTGIVCHVAHCYLPRYRLPLPVVDDDWVLKIPGDRDESPRFEAVLVAMLKTEARL